MHISSTVGELVKCAKQIYNYSSRYDYCSCLYLANVHGLFTMTKAGIGGHYYLCM